MATRSELLNDIDIWLARDDLSSGGSEATFLRLAQSEIDKRVRLRAQEVTIQFTATTRAVDLPTDYLAMRSLSLNTVLDRVVEYLTPERIRESPIWFNQGGFQNGREQAPQAYTIIGNQIILAPAPPTDGIGFDMTYIAQLPRLVNDGDTNSLLTNYYDVYLWAVLKAATKFLEETDLADRYERDLNNAIGDLERSERLGRFAGSALISTGSPRRVV